MIEHVELEGLRAWLVEDGFRIYTNHLKSESNECNWYASRWTKHAARECETNSGKDLAIFVWPHVFSHPAITSRPESCSIEVCAEAGGIWYKLNAYSLKPDDVMAKLQTVEQSLVAAWNAIPVEAAE